MLRKVFCIGFHKTGTKSLAIALRQLGYSVTGPNGTHDPDIKDNVYDMAYGLVDQFDAFQDNPWPILYKELDSRFPGSKFILTLRSPEAWILSQVRHFGSRETPMRSWIYGEGCPKGNEQLYVARFERHNHEVIGYFSGRSTDLLIMDLSKGDGWDKLCPFLGFDLPANTFPHANKAENRRKNNSPARRLLRRVEDLWRLDKTDLS